MKINFWRRDVVQVGVMVAVLGAEGAWAGEIHFTDVTSQLGIEWSRAASAEHAINQQIQQASLQQPVTLEAFPWTPNMAHGWPDVAIFDVGGDGDLDVFVANGPGRANSLLINQWAKSGVLGFVDQAASAGVAVPAMDGSGVCAGDLDNDGDSDLVVLGRSQANRLFENQGYGTFAEVANSGFSSDSQFHVSCSLGDVDGDGLLDLAVANTFDPISNEAIFAVPFALTQLNQLYRNSGGLQFTDINASSGIQDSDRLPPGAGGITWSVSMVDIDLDGDTDIIWVDDQGGIPTLKNDPAHGIDRGFIHLAINDGAGQFTDAALALSDVSASSWMGLGFGDLDCDGRLDIFGSNFGDFGLPVTGSPYELGEQATRYYLGLGQGLYQESVPEEGTAFGWGNAVFDADNDGDSDVVYNGGVEITFLAERDNPGVLLNNRGCIPGIPQLETRVDAFDGRHLNRNVLGMAIGDLDRDGFVDIVTAANWKKPELLPLVPAPVVYGGILDATAFFMPIFAPVAPGQLVWTGLDLEEGDLKIEINDGSFNHGVSVALVGGMGVTPEGKVNRNGIGVVVAFVPVGKNQKTAMMPITAGSSHLSSHALEGYFGQGRKPWGTVDILWPDGVRNRLFGVRRGERVTVLEIPCAIDTGLSFHACSQCVRGALSDYQNAGTISRRQKNRLCFSALLAYLQEH